MTIRFRLVLLVYSTDANSCIFPIIPFACIPTSYIPLSTLNPESDQYVIRHTFIRKEMVMKMENINIPPSPYR